MKSKSSNTFKIAVIAVDFIVGGNKSINIDGRGGTGKSTLIGKLQNAMDEKELKYVTLAPSNKAARQIKGNNP